MAVTSNFTWTWVKGSDTPFPSYSYGTKDVFSASNTPDGRYGALTVTAPNGNFYLFGGAASFTVLNDIWIYNPQLNQWKWINGSSDIDQKNIHPAPNGIDSLSNYPASRYGSVYVIGLDSNLYMFGGVTVGAGIAIDRSNDLWRYNFTTNSWAFLGGSDDVKQNGKYGTKGIPSDTNWPGARYLSMMWAAPNNKLYLFGGNGLGASGTTPQVLNDLWSYNITTRQWTWLSGSDGPGQLGNYGQKNIPSTNNSPGARHGSATWVGKDGNLYLFGGFDGSDSYNDIWRFNPSDKTWAWVKGSNTLGQPGIYGTQNVESDTNTPGGRNIMAYWVNKADYLFIFGGFGVPENSANRGKLNDLWMLNLKTMNWTWLKGDKIVHSVGFYGTQGVSNDLNNPRSRDFSYGQWIDASDNIYLFGGLTISDVYNDIWRGTIPCNLTISDIQTFPSVITSGQPFNVTWQLAPTIFPVNYQASLTFKGSDYRANFTTLSGMISLPGQGIGTYSDTLLRVIALNAANCSDVKLTSVTVVDPATLSVLVSYLPSMIITFIIIYLCLIGIFLYDLIGEER